jgi:hypothetical protein
VYGRYAILVGLGLINSAAAQFTPAFLQNASYWGDGKAEFDFYDAQIARDGQLRPCEVVHILVREPFDYNRLPGPDQAKPDRTTAVIKMNQILNVPTGIYGYQQMHSNYWDMVNGLLLKFSLTSSDATGNTFKIGTLTTQPAGDKRENALRIRTNSYRYAVEEDETVSFPPFNYLFYDELPLRVRTIDFAFSKVTGDFEIQLAPSMINSSLDKIVFKPAKVSFKISEHTVDVDVKHEAGADHFVLDRDFPFLLREWRMADGSRLKMKNSLKVDYRNYLKNGDRERALKDPMLRHPD